MGRTLTQVVNQIHAMDSALPGEGLDSQGPDGRRPSLPPPRSRPRRSRCSGSENPCWSLALPFSLLPHGSPAGVIHESPLAHLLLLTWKAEAPRLSLPEDQVCSLWGPLSIPGAEGQVGGSLAPAAP